MVRTTYSAIALPQSNTQVPGGPQSLWRQPRDKQVAKVGVEGKRNPDEIIEELHVPNTRVQCQYRQC